MKLKDLIKSGTRNLANWSVVRDGDNTILTVDDCDNQRTVAIEATEEYGESADRLYSEIYWEAEFGEYCEFRDANRYSIWELAFDRKDGYRLYIMLDSETCDYIFLASGSSQCIYRSDEEMLTGFFDVVGIA